MFGHFVGLTMKCSYADLPLTKDFIFFFPLINVLSQTNIYIHFKAGQLPLFF